MADNFLERQYDDYLRQKTKKDQDRKARWRKQLKEYQKRMAADKEKAK